MRQNVDMTDLTPLRPIRAYGIYTPAPPVKRGIPRGWYWLGALALSLVLWSVAIWGLYAMMMGQL